MEKIRRLCHDAPKNRDAGRRLWLIAAALLKLRSYDLQIVKQVVALAEILARSLRWNLNESIPIRILPPLETSLFIYHSDRSVM